MVFDMITHEEFEAAHSDKTFKERYENLVWAIGDESKHVECLNQIKIDTLQKFKQFMDKSRELKWEGIVLRRMASLYEGKRIKDILKAKDFKDAEYTVVSVVNTVMRHIVDGLEVESPMLGKVMIKHKENLVGVGSGWSIEERLHYYEHPEEIIGKVITVSYFDESQDKDGNCSLQHPTLVCIHGDRRET
jgi:DNA ligase-1